MVKYQIFVSSTYEDLKHERDQVVKAILEMGHIPVGMEMFSAADQEQWQIIQRHIEASDYYVVIVAHRYGSMVDGIGYTEKEYDYALSLGVPILGFVLHKDAPWPDGKRDSGTDSVGKQAKLAAFKEKVARKPINYWSNADELHGRVAIALGKIFMAQPRTGWVPASQAATPQAAAELARLSKENSELRDSNARLRQGSSERARHEEIESSLMTKVVSVTLESNVVMNEDVHLPVTYLDIFDAISQSLIDMVANHTLATSLLKRLIALPPQPSKEESQAHSVMQHRLEDVIREPLDEYCLQDLVTFEKIRSESRIQLGSTWYRLWTLTDLGRSFVRFRREPERVGASK